MSAPSAFTSVRRDPLLRFLLLCAALYLGWRILYALAVQPSGTVDLFLIDQLIDWSGTILRSLGYTLIPEPANAEDLRTIGVQGGSLLWIGVPCNGLAVFAVFLIFLMAYPGPWKHKVWFGLLGLLTIHVINALRVAALCIIVTIDYEWLNFNHDYVFYVVVYGWVFLLWYIWVKRFSSLNVRSS